MIQHGYCPRCNTQIPTERLTPESAICACGWTDEAPFKRATATREKNVVWILIGSASLMLLSFAHLVNWGGYALRIPSVKAAHWTGSLSAEGYLELAEACVALNKWSCAQDAYLAIHRKTGDPAPLAALAHLQFRIGDKQAALSSYSVYQQAGGKDSQALLRFGNLLEDLNRNDEALKVLESSIAMRPDLLHVRATSAIVRILMKQGRNEEAYLRVLAFHASSGNAKGYLNSELERLESIVGQASQKAPAEKGDSELKRKSPPAKPNRNGRVAFTSH